MTDPSPSQLQTLASECGCGWPIILRASADAETVRANLVQQATSRSLVPADTSFVVFGSLARGEWTKKSDLDWTLLVDGEVRGEHADVSRGLTKMAVDLKYQEPGPTRTFGTLTFSHDLLHFIGGEEDTNANTTRRILLLLESMALGGESVRERVVKALLDRYVGEDLLYHDPKSYGVPRFLLNDFSRYWRMMTVDSAQKRRDRANGWALRNVKLQLSRKLIFVSGLWSCLECELLPSARLTQAREKGDRDALRDTTTSTLFRSFERTPLENVASFFLKYRAIDAARKSFDAYDQFLTILDDEDERKHLRDLEASTAHEDAVFQRARRAASDFQEGLLELFFKSDEELTRAAQTYGVF